MIVVTQNDEAMTVHHEVVKEVGVVKLVNQMRNRNDAVIAFEISAKNTH